jgi:hypothetical protein
MNDKTLTIVELSLILVFVFLFYKFYSQIVGFFSSTGEKALEVLHLKKPVSMDEQTQYANCWNKYKTLVGENAGLYCRSPYFAQRIMSIIYHESTGNSALVGSQGEVGLMQLAPITINGALVAWRDQICAVAFQAQSVSSNNFANDVDNIQVGAWYLNICLDLSGQDLDQATKRYNGSGLMTDIYLSEVLAVEKKFTFYGFTY